MQICITLLQYRANVSWFDALLALGIKPSFNQDKLVIFLLLCVIKNLLWLKWRKIIQNRKNLESFVRISPQGTIIRSIHGTLSFTKKFCFCIWISMIWKKYIYTNNTVLLKYINVIFISIYSAKLFWLKYSSAPWMIWKLATKSHIRSRRMS